MGCYLLYHWAVENLMTFILEFEIDLFYVHELVDFIRFLEIYSAVHICSTSLPMNIRQETCSRSVEFAAVPDHMANIQQPNHYMSKYYAMHLIVRDLIIRIFTGRY